MYKAKLRVELSQSRAEQREYLRNVELAAVLDKRAEKKRENGEAFNLRQINFKSKKRSADSQEAQKQKKPRMNDQMDQVLGNVF